MLLKSALLVLVDNRLQVCCLCAVRYWRSAVSRSEVGDRCQHPRLPGVHGHVLRLRPDPEGRRRAETPRSPRCNNVFHGV